MSETLRPVLLFYAGSINSCTRKAVADVADKLWRVDPTVCAGKTPTTPKDGATPKDGGTEHVVMACRPNVDEFGGN
eukprot:6460931-Amphidinium_carterae.1